MISTTKGLWLAILMASHALASSVIPMYFNVTYIGTLINDDLPGGYDETGVSIEDPATKTSTQCGVDFNRDEINTINGYAPIEWVKCDDPTFAIRYESFISDTQYRVGLRHQYRRNGIPCLKSSGPECITRLSYADFNTSVPGFNYANAANSYSGASSGEWSANGGPFTVPVYRHCHSCASNQIGGS